MAKAVRLLAALSASQLEGDDLLKAARALAAATAALLNAAQPENMEVATGKRAMGADWGGAIGGYWGRLGGYGGRLGGYGGRLEVVTCQGTMWILITHRIDSSC